MAKYPWEDELLSIKNGKEKGIIPTYKQLAERFGTTPAVIGIVLHKSRHPEYDKRKYYKAVAEKRFKEVMEQRMRDYLNAVRRYPDMPPLHLRILKAYTDGLGARDCGTRAGCSYTWANIILKSYGCKTRKRITKKTRERVLYGKE